MVSKVAERVSHQGERAVKPMWLYYQVELQFGSPLAASIPKTPEEIRLMLENRKMSDAGFAKAVKASQVLKTVDELAEEVAGEVGANEEEERGWATFKKDEHGLYYEARCVKSHLKDCANIMQRMLGITALKSKVANRVYIHPEKIYVFGPDGAKREPDGYETRMVHVITMKGPRSSIKSIDYVRNAHLTFQMKVLNDGEVGPGVLESILTYGGEHGMGQERSMDFGRYGFLLKQVSAAE